jgi:hypothetical protein
MTLPIWHQGDEITAAKLSDMVEGINDAANLRVDPATGLQLVRLPAGNSVIRSFRPMEIWVKITSGGASGIYGGTQQLEGPGGTWANGPRVFTTGGANLIEANVLATVPITGSVIVRAFRDRINWRFHYGAC